MRTWIVIATLAVTGCASVVEKEAKRDFSSNEVAVKNIVRDAEVRKQAPVLHMNGAWLGGKAVQISQKEKELPPVFPKSWTLAFPDRVSLNAVAERITKVTGVPVRIAPDVFTRAAGATAASSSQPAAGAQAPQPVAGSMVGGTASDSMQGMDLQINYTGSLNGLLDIVTARAGISWSFHDSAIHIFRYETRTFVLNSVPGSSSLSASVGGGGSSGGSGGGGGIGGGSGGGSGGGGSGQSTSMESSSLSIWSATEATVKTMLSQGGKVIATPATGTITVTDTPDIVQRVASMIERENKRMSRQIRLQVQVYSVVSDQITEQGINWNALLATLAGDYKLGFTSAANVVSTGAGAITSNILKRDVSVDIVLKALNTFGKASFVTTANKMALNNRPTTLDVALDTDYVKSSQTTQTINVGTTQSLTPGTVSTGFTINLLPHVIENDSIFLQFALRLAELEDLKPVQSGNSMIQLPTVSRRNTLDQVALRNGETLVLTGLERILSKTNNSGTIPSAGLLLGGTDKAQVRKEALVVMITPVIVEGGI